MLATDMNDTEPDARDKYTPLDPHGIAYYPREYPTLSIRSLGCFGCTASAGGKGWTSPRSILTRPYTRDLTGLYFWSDGRCRVH